MSFIGQAGGGGGSAERIFELVVFDPTTDIDTGDGKMNFTIPDAFDGYSILSATATVTTAGSSGDTTISIENITAGVDVLSTSITIASGSDTATAGVVKSNGDEILSALDRMSINIDTVSSTAPQGLIVIVVVG